MCFIFIKIHPVMYEHRFPLFSTEELGPALFPTAAGPEAWAPPHALAYPELAPATALHHAALVQHPLTQLPVRVSVM